MCESCLAESEIVIDQLLPGYSLNVATKDSPNIKWRAGSYALVRSNGPDFVFPVTPTKEPNDDDMDAWYRWRMDVVWPIREAIMNWLVDPVDVYRLVHAAMQDGYNPDVDGEFTSWFVNHCAKEMEIVGVQNGCA